MKQALEIINAIKDYKELRALKGINLTVPKGEFFGLLGPNGAGKSTLIQTIVGLKKLSSGNINVFGHDIEKKPIQSKRLIGYSPQEVNLEWFFSIKKILEFQAGFFGATPRESKKIALHLLDQFGLSDKAEMQFTKLSGGMQKRVLIAKALVSKPELLFLDEPTAGVDVEQRHELWKYLRMLNEQGTTIILTTHYIDEAEELCERVGIINLGEIKELGSPKELIEKYCKTEVNVSTNQPINPDKLNNLSHLDIKTTERCISATGDRAGVMTEKILKAILEQGSTVKDINIKQGNLESVFLQIVGKSFEEIEREDVC